jgi:AraC-like DNA-binding protein
MGPVADALLRAGAPLQRVFARAEAPLGLIDNPDRIIPLRDQLALVEHATREIGDEALPVRLSSGAGVGWLGPYGVNLQSAATLRDAIVMANTLIAEGLQTATEMRISEHGRQAIWTYRVVDDATFGRQRNELLAFGYMQDLVRAFVGRSWRADHVVLPGPLAACGVVEQALGTHIRNGEIAGIALASELLELPNPARKGAAALDPLPHPDDFLGIVAQLTRTSLLLDQRARIDWIAGRLEMSARTLQRRLGQQGVSFLHLRNAIVRDEARRMLARGARATDVASELGYADPAHFSRAFRAWTGVSPTAFRRRLMPAGTRQPDRGEHHGPDMGSPEAEPAANLSDPGLPDGGLLRRGMTPG